MIARFDFRKSDRRLGRLHLQLLQMLQIVCADDEDLVGGLDRRAAASRRSTRRSCRVNSRALSSTLTVSFGAQSSNGLSISRIASPFTNPQEICPALGVSRQFQTVPPYFLLRRSSTSMGCLDGFAEAG